MRKLICTFLAVLTFLCVLTSCDVLYGGNAPDTEKKEDVVEVIDGYLVVNGNKTEHKVHTEPTISVIDGYVAVNGVKTEYEVNKADVITVLDGYLVVNGVKTEYEVELSCDHVWETETIAPTCTEVGYEIKTCSVCEKRIKLNKTPAKSHQYGAYVTNNEYHWLECTACGEEKDRAMHSLNDDGECEACGIPLSETPGILYDISADYAMVVGYTGTAKKVKIASEYNGVPVKTIYNSAFSGKDNITSVVIPDSVTSIGYEAFRNCYSLTSVVIPDSVTNIGDSAFYYCDSLTSVVIGDSVTSIGDMAFYNCSSLTSVVIGDSVKSIGKEAFAFCDSLSSVVIPDSVTYIGSSAFYYCRSLTSVVIPDSVTSIGNSAFSGCHSSLYTEYEFGKYVRSGDNPYAVLIEITNENFSAYTIHEDTKHIAYKVFSSCSRLTEIVIPDSVTSIGDYAFSNCDSLTSVVIPDSVTSIGGWAFNDCDSLTSVVIGDGVTSIGDNAFSYCDNLRDVYYTGSEEEWSRITISSLNQKLASATKHYNYIPE